MRITVINKDVNEKDKEDDYGCGGFIILITVLALFIVAHSKVRQKSVYEQNEYWRKQLVAYGYAEYRADGTWNWKGK